MILWGYNPSGTTESGLMIRQIFDAKEKGAKLIVIDPLLTPLAAKADIWGQIRPGTDCALALAMLNVIVNEELYDRDFVNKWTYGFEKLEEHIQEFPPEKMEKITWIKAEVIREIARTYATYKPACIYDGNGLDQYPNCVQTARAICILRAITGNLDVPGGDLIPDTIPTVDITLKGMLPKGVKPVDDFPLFREFTGQVPAPSVIDAILTGKPYPIKAMIVQGGNPALTLANSTKVREALRKLEFLVVMDLFFTRTAELADIILPAATSFEKTGLTAYPSLRTNFIMLQQKVIEPLGESWPDWKFWFELAKKMGYRQEFPWKDVEEAIDELISPSGLTVAKLKEGPILLPRRYKKFEEKGFPSIPSGKVQIYSEILKDHGFEPLPTYIEPPETPTSRPELLGKYPLMGVCWPRSVYVHTQHRNVPWLRSLDPDPLVRINPKDANERNIEDGCAVIITSPRGSIKVKAKVTQKVPLGIVAISWGWGQTIIEANINDLTDDTVRDPITGTTPNRLFLCEVQKI